MTRTIEYLLITALLTLSIVSSLLIYEGRLAQEAIENQEMSSL